MSSRSSYNPLKYYDVFLNFRGIDTRYGFTNHLYNALVRENYEIFIDNEELERGGDIKTGLLEAIENSRCSMVILSENYASSTSCLRELAKIVECMKTVGQIVLPVFYHLEPSHVKELRVPTYKKEFAKYERNSHKFDYEEVQRWKNALKTVSGLAGWTIEEEKDIEAEKIEEIVAYISSILPADVAADNLDSSSSEICKRPMPSSSSGGSSNPLYYMNSYPPPVQMGVTPMSSFITTNYNSQPISMLGSHSPYMNPYPANRPSSSIMATPDGRNVISYSKVFPGGNFSSTTTIYPGNNAAPGYSSYKSSTTTSYPAGANQSNQWP